MELTEDEKCTVTSCGECQESKDIFLSVLEEVLGEWLIFVGGTLEDRLIFCKNPHLLQILTDRIQREPANIVRQTLSCVKKYFQKA